MSQRLVFQTAAPATINRQRISEFEVCHKISGLGYSLGVSQLEAFSGKYGRRRPCVMREQPVVQSHEVEFNKKTQVNKEAL